MNQELLSAIGLSTIAVVAAALYFRIGPDEVLKEREPVLESTEIDEQSAEVIRENVSELKTSFMLKLLPIAFFTQVIIAVILCMFYKAGLNNIVLTEFYLSALWAVSFYDFHFRLIPNRILAASLVIRVIIFAAELVVYGGSAVLSLLLSGAIAAAGLGVAAILCRLISPNSVGFGDVKLLLVTGVYLGLDKAFGAVLPSMVLLFVVSVYLLTVKKVSRKTELPFAPFLLGGTLLGALLMGI